MKRPTGTQRGQALIFVALAIVGIVGFSALAIDGGNIFSDRRHSQNASDTSSYAAALGLVRTETGEFTGDWKQLGIDRAANNGYSSADGITKVHVYSCDELIPPVTVDGYTMTCVGRGMPDDADPKEYVYTHIRSRVKLFFAPVIGWREVFNNTDAVVLAAAPKETSLFPGYALVSTMLNCPNYNHDPFKVQGSSVTTIIDAGILVNSSCQDPDPAYDQDSGASKVKTTTGVCVAGDFDYANTVPPPTHCEPIDINRYTLPNPTCSHEGIISKNSDGDWVATPGLYGPNFNYDSIVDVNPNGKLYLTKGIYCFYDGLNLNSQWDITTDLDNEDDYDSATEGVFFFVPDGDITFNGSSDIHIHAIDSTMDGFPKDYVNYLIYVPPYNANDIYITGGNGSTFTGTILAPNSYIRMNGGSGTIGLDSQIIGYAIALEGNGTLDINYKAENNAKTTYNPSITGIK